MKISEIDKLGLGDQFSYQGWPAIVMGKREKDDSLSNGVEEVDKSVCLTFRSFRDKTSHEITLISRLDAKMDKGGYLYELDLPEYQPDQLIDIL